MSAAAGASGSGEESNRLAWLEARVAELERREAATAGILRAISESTGDARSVLQQIVEVAAGLIDAAGVSLFGLEPDGRLRLQARTWAPEFAEAMDRLGIVARPVGYVDQPGTRSVATIALDERRTVHIPDLAAVPVETLPHPGPRQAEIRTLLAVPLLRGDRVLGLLQIGTLRPDAFAPGQIAILETFADQAAIALENARLVAELQERLDQQTAIADVLRSMAGAASSMQPVLDTLVGHVRRLVGAANANLFEAVEGGMRCAAMTGASEEFRALVGDNVWQIEAPDGSTSVPGAAIRDGRIINLADVDAEPPDRWAEVRQPIRSREVIRAALSIPLRRGDTVLGALSIWRDRPEPFTEAQTRLVSTFADQAALALENTRLFRELEHRSYQLEVASRHKSEFLANMSHELRTPLNAVIGFTEVLLQRYFGDLNPKQDEYLRDVLTSGQHLLSLINDILDLSKVEAGRMELELSTFALEDVLQSGLVMVRERAQRKGLALELDVDQGTGRIEADERKVKQVLFNLLTNAVKFTPEGGRVTIAARRAEDQVTISVADTGVGIAPEEQARVFDEFGQAGGAKGQTEGTGLGLTLARRFVELHGGTIGLESEVGRGTTFSVTLPVRQGTT